MPDLTFEVGGVRTSAQGLTPLLEFGLRVANDEPTERVHAALLQVQIQIESGRRTYNAREQEKLVDLFGTPDRWGETLRNRLWTHAQATTRPFTGSTEVTLAVPCTYDLNLAAAKYFYALEQGDIPLLFLFSGTIFYALPDGRIQVQQISWSKECAYRVPVSLWKEMMETHYPNSAWLYLHRDVFERLYAYRRRHGLPTWEQTIERLLTETPSEGVSA